MDLSTPLGLCVALCGVIIAVTWGLSVLTREYSWVDRIWSVAPAAYAWIYVADAPSPRVILMASLVTLWGARLTFNYARKGGYAKGGEDYRWAVLRERLGPAWFQVFNATFIAPYQNALILLFTLPIHVAWQAGDHPLGPPDALCALGFVAMLTLETVADQQQWRFHQDKAARKARGELVDPPFLTTGLFRWSRHPNFFAEQAIWWCFYGFVLAVGAGPLHPAITGTVLLTLLFQGSTAFTEKITLGKYPSYARYQATTSRLIPLPPRS